MPFTSAEYLDEMKSIRQLIKDDRAKFAGLEEMKNDEDKLKFNQRIKSLWEDYYRVKKEYEEALKCESGDSVKSKRVREGINGT